MWRLFEGLHGVDDMLGGGAKFIGNVATKSNKTTYPILRCVHRTKLYSLLKPDFNLILLFMSLMTFFYGDADWVWAGNDSAHF